MKIQSQTKLSLTQHHGMDRMKVRFNETPVSITHNGITVQGYEYDECEVSDNPTRSELIEAMIATVYPPGTELSLINSFNRGGKIVEYTELLKWVESCKYVADAILAGTTVTTEQVSQYIATTNPKPAIPVRDATGALDWVAKEEVKVDTERMYSSIKYKCIQAHVTQIDWTPNITPALWSVVATSSNWTFGVAYKINDIVTYVPNGFSYKCLQAHTAIEGWEPPSVPALWQKQ